MSKAIDGFLEAEEAYVVRSSATAEDLPTASFAGQHDTVLDVSGHDEVLDAVSECMASLFTDRAISYRKANDISHDDVAMGVVIQRMVDADISGVLFTADALTGNRTIASIDAASGLGEAVVSGTVTADNVRVDKQTNDIIEYRSSHSEDSMEFSDQQRILRDEQVLRLVSYGNRIEDLFGPPQDIEWSITNDQVWILQSRPITSLFPVPTPAPNDDGLHVYYSYNHRQGMIDPMPPLSVDYVRQYTMWTLENLFAYHPSEFTSVAGAGGFVYLDVTPMLRSERLAQKWLAGIEEMDEPGVVPQREIVECRGDQLSSAPAVGDGSLRAYLGAIRTFARTAAVGGARTVWGLLNPNYEQFPSKVRTEYEQHVEEAIISIQTAESESDRIRRTVSETSKFGWTATKQLETTAGFISRRILRWLCPDCESEFEALDKGLRDNVTISMVLELGDLADIARESPAVAEALESGAEIDEIRDLEESTEFVAAFDRFMQTYGHRASSELDPSQPRYCEDPSPLLSTIRSRLAGGCSGEHREKLNQLEADADVAIARLEDIADRGFFGSIRRRLVKPLASRYRNYKSTRETPKYAYTHLWAEFRRQVLVAGERLEREGQLQNVDDVWLLQLEELLTALEDPEAWEDLNIDLESRKAEYRAHRTLRGPRVITSNGEIPRGTSSPDQDDSGLVGVATSSGSAEGIARVVHDPRTQQIEEGEILVCPYTDPGWTPLFLNAVGLVTDVGGVFSHGSLVAREYGIPSVVVDGATDRIETGQRIRVDGDAGRVEIIEETP
ncbi:phosphoenolpyruvate synthase [Natronococcus amylolyticus DSM 10524]|uniref:Phosphoenolpyruvate synthase n=1 Tax=Natronococcus amylolyticus DSM 10524 TaxID=1227497 RepID=L9X4T6_9EURY|nr:phosphoenolpyruvate synthase [Natronococcus amylolyticus DSM 10524]